MSPAPPCCSSCRLDEPAEHIARDHIMREDAHSVAAVEVMALDDDTEQFVEWDPSRRYARYPEILGKGAMKTVYRAYDLLDCKEVAWSKANELGSISCGEEAFSVQHEVQLLTSLHHNSIVELYAAWSDPASGRVNFITELCYSNLLEYRLKHRHVSRKAIKCWGRQILLGLSHLHAQQPPIVHRDLKCENIFIKCSSLSTLKIGDFGCATSHDDRHGLLHCVVGTPEFMAPEIFQENYNELVDIYSFGMCMLELLTGDCPYSDCNGAAEVYKKVINGVKPRALHKVKDVEALSFITRCLLPASHRPSARELLSDRFLQCTDDGHSSNGVVVLRKSTSVPDMALSGFGVQERSDMLKSGPFDQERSSAHVADTTACASMYEENLVQPPGEMKDSVDLLAKPTADSTVSAQQDGSGGTGERSGPTMCVESTKGTLRSSNPLSKNAMEMVVRNLSASQSCRLMGKVLDEKTIKFLLHIEDSHHAQSIKFPFDLKEDTPASVAEEMVRALRYPKSDMEKIADLISQGIRELTACDIAEAQAPSLDCAIAASGSNGAAEIEGPSFDFRQSVAA